MPSLVVIFIFLFPQAWNKLRLESRGLRVLICAKVFVSSSKASRRIVPVLKFGRRAQRRPVGLIVSTLIFSIFSFVSFICIYHEYTHPMVFFHTIGYPNLSIV